MSLTWDKNTQSLTRNRKPRHSRILVAGIYAQIANLLHHTQYGFRLKRPPE